MESIIMNIRKSDNIKNSIIRARTRAKDVGCTIKKTKFSYTGHMIRSEKAR